VADYVHCQRRIIVSKQFEKDRLIIDLLEKPVVKHGPFTGLIYPEFIYHNNPYFSKIMGSYEQEISHLIEKICQNNFQQIINIGCADGYYAVGFAKRIPNVSVFAYDRNKRARKHCSEMASLNHVADRVFINNTFVAEMVKEFNFSGKSFILCDCEGDEKKIFTKATLSYFILWELLIEVHDFIDLTIGDHLKEVFSTTHDIEIFKSIDDLTKARNYHFDETDKLDIEMRKGVFGEGRPAPMEWFYLTPRSSLL
jgi:hypothetical protein